MGFSTRKFKTLRRKRDRLPIGTIVDNAGHTYAAGDGHPHEMSVGTREAGTQDDLVVYRLNSWRNLVKEYTTYFEAFASAQKAAKKALDRAVDNFNVPLQADHCFAGVERNGVLQLSAQLRNVHQMYSTQHIRLVQHTESNTLEQLEALRSEVKDCTKEYIDHMNPIYKRLRKQAKTVEEYKYKLSRVVEAYNKRHRSQDAWLVLQQVRRELSRQAELENSLVKAMQAEHQRLLRWEASLSERFRDIVAATMVCERDSLQTTLGSIGNCLGFLDHFDTNAESRSFDQHFGSVLHTPMGLTGNSSLADYEFMHKDSEAAAVLLEGWLERESGMIKKYHNEYAVLTQQGYLHCFADQKDLLERNPEISFHLTGCSVVPLDDVRSFTVTINDKKLGRSKYAFRCAEPSIADHWVNAISSVISKPQVPELHIVGGTLRDSQAAMDAAAAAASAPNGLPTASGAPAHELAAQNAAKDDAREQPKRISELSDAASAAAERKPEEITLPTSEKSPLGSPTTNERHIVTPAPAAEETASTTHVADDEPANNLLSTFEQPTSTTN
ncbi:hypothetical protein IWW36_004618 [Coemansia brasiliensis]|uniref:PH domain-containing protein n=1 Tax=Coemansia brasiliensis TaxID=2650707 RepID=A0A9W8LYM1_9FUNG|nr:hypothetical protein IWW36_004618 [Coemansia brasiliensis]